MDSEVAFVAGRSELKGAPGRAWLDSLPAGDPPYVSEQGIMCSPVRLAVRCKG